MNRLQTQYPRLSLPRTAEASRTASAHPSHPEPPAEDTVRALVLALRKPADWDTLSPLWRGVQADWA
jgi:hypothetical protein